VLERVASVEHEVGDRFPRRRDPEDPPASRGWSTPKLILPKRGVWERHADAIRFCATDTNSDPFCGDVASDRAWRCWRALAATVGKVVATGGARCAVVRRRQRQCQLAKANGAERRPTMVTDDLGPPSDLP
jgi:hypothetical protein